jgi:hypothetical protein
MRKISSIILIVFISIIVIVLLVLRPIRSHTIPEHTQSTREHATLAISEEKISEENFSGTIPHISGTSPLATLATDFLAKEIDAFKARADAEVPERAAEFGVGSPPATYTIDITATVKRSAHTESIIFDEYQYMGGANGMSKYRVLTIDSVDGHQISIAELIAQDQQDAFVAFVKKQLQSGPHKIEGLFPEEVAKLTLDDFEQWSLTDSELSIYFDKYTIGPGALGAVAFPIATADAVAYLANPLLVD